ncbi:MAG TPA: polysaccharide deacetylase family protein [Terracidiphilus sp.]|nr:polysaccharide deacetylase family protein [Terracidiphilus sp.]
MISALGTEIYAGLGAAGFLGLAAGGCAYAALWPGSRIFGSALTAPAQAEEFALTFDDGPNPKWTPRLLDVLAKHNVKATFFMMGVRAQMQPALVQRVVAEGHLIGNHTWSHPNLAMTSARKVREELVRTSGTLELISGQKVEYFRPPFGARRPAVFQIARELGLRVMTWNAMTSDWSETSAERIAGKLTATIEELGRRGRAANVVLHDGGHREPAAERGASVAAAGMLVERFLGTRRFVRVDAWGISSPCL